MPTYQQTTHKVRERSRSAARQAEGTKTVHNRPERFAPAPGIQELLRRLGIGLQKLATALHYHLHQLVSAHLSDFRLPWFKLALAAIAFVILAQKNIQFSINMKAPLSASPDDREAAAEPGQMSLAQPIAFKNQPDVFSMPATRHVEAYIDRFSKVAKAEQEKYGIPASLKMAQAILESQAGQSTTARAHYNHFGAPLSNRIFDSAWENWRAHSLLLVRYFPELSEQKAPTSEWAAAIQQSGLVNDKNYADRLTGIIRQYGLKKLD